MTVEVIKAEVSHQEEKVKVVDEVVVEAADVKKDVEAKPKAVEKSSSFKEESNFVSDLKDHEKKALTDLKAKLEEAILGNSLFKKEEPKVVEEKVEEVVEEKVEEVVEEKAEEVEEKKEEEKIECVKEEVEEKVEEKEGEKVEEKPQEEGEVSKKPAEKKGLNLRSKIKEVFKGHNLLRKKSKKEVEEKEKPVVEEKEGEESKPEGEAVVVEKVEEVVELVKTEECEEKKVEAVVEEVAEVVKTEECEVKEPEVVAEEVAEVKEPEVVVEEVAEVIKAEECEEEKKVEEEVVIVDRDISLWGVPLLPSKADDGTDVVLLKFLRARDFKVNEAFEMLKKTLEWRKEWKIDSILDEDLGSDLSAAAYMSGVDRKGHPICYNILGVFNDEELYQKTFGSEEQRNFFLRWRFQLMERGIQKLELKPSGVTSMLQITDLKNSPGPAKKEVAIKQAVGLLQDNYPEFVARNIFINVPFWDYFHAVLFTRLTQRTKSKSVFARPARVTETLIKYIPIEEIPVQYGGLKRESDYEFSAEDGVASELIIKASSTATIEIPAPQAGTTFIWDITVLGWEVNHKEEFIPTDEGSYTTIVQKGKKLSSVEGPVRNTYRTNEPGKIVLTIENCSSKKKKVFYRHKVKKCAF